jgi:polyhydroxybutyrate depolymerase
MSLHPSFSNADNHMNAAKWQLLGETENFISVYPNGTSNQAGSTNYSWNAYNLSTGSTADDVGFLNAVLNKMITDYNINTCKIYISGFSNGAWMTWRMMCDFADRFAAVGPLSGSWKYGRDGFCDHGGCNGSTIPGTNPPSEEAHLNCTPSRKLPYMYYRGTNEVNLTDRAVTDLNGNFFWSQFNDCETTPVVDTIEDLGDTIVREHYINCDNVDTYIMNVVGNSHTWHASATRQFWNFFRDKSSCNTLSNAQNNNFNPFKIYPNPVSNNLFIDVTGNYSIAIINYLGQSVYNNSFTGDNSISTSQFQNGIYIVVIKKDNLTRTHKLIIKH